MRAKNKRVLWLLNHKTLMPYEARLLCDLGFEVFTPKVIPESSSFRSNLVDHRYDASLSLPRRVLDRLNAFNFYEDRWPDDIVALINRYFATAYVIPYGVQVREAVDKFEGQIMFRAFGLDNTKTYTEVLQVMHGPEILADLGELGERFWFAQGYEQLQECEVSLFANRAVTLPIGVPDSFWDTADSYTGTDKHILFVCPNCVTNPYYADVYRAFKRDFGDLPHYIIGAQDVPVDDPCVLGFVSDAELARLYRDCAVLYYHSTELRHVHYSPVEAAINGMPVVYFADSLLGRMTPEITHGRVDSLVEARRTVERILAGDEAFVAAVCADQRSLAYKFSDAYCRAEWEKNLVECGYMAALQPEPFGTVLLREAVRSLARPLLHGRSRFRRSYSFTLEEDDHESTFHDGIDFGKLRYPAFVRRVLGVSMPESGGRWSIGKTIDISLAEPLPKAFKLVIKGGAYGPNVGVPIEIRVGRARRSFCFSWEPGGDSEATVDFSLHTAQRLIRITVPEPTVPPNDIRTLGIALHHMRIEREQTFQEGIDFVHARYPDFVLRVDGLAGPESGGRWSIGKTVDIELARPLPKAFKLVLRGGAYGPNIGAPIEVMVGDERRTFRFSSEPGSDDEVAVDFATPRAHRHIQIIVPEPTVPPNDIRALGIALRHMKILPG
ncbi:hypothetical protein ATSB10_35970 [Dyella thiooxydans]|uniref:DUF7024 domain-containing protein n=1 Tax=Dyella thiooxydans TaxID=445710 RepID=A0A160N4P8_9GAMM|nr:hypothetical protein [Dyella thiooxydans]AND71051.1 hypothetical protein ATSB10_35970 [Dyella thiooxydans]